MPAATHLKKKLVLSKETVRLLNRPQGTGPMAVTTQGPTEVHTYCYCPETEPSWCYC